MEIGHTFMEVDFILLLCRNCTIEEKFIHPQASSGPCETIYCSGDDFYSFEPVYYENIRPGKKVGDPCVNDVVAFQNTSNGLIR